MQRGKSWETYILKVRRSRRAFRRRRTKRYKVPRSFVEGPDCWRSDLESCRRWRSTAIRGVVSRIYFENLLFHAKRSSSFRAEKTRFFRPVTVALWEEQTLHVLGGDRKLLPQISLPRQVTPEKLRALLKNVVQKRATLPRQNQKKTSPLERNPSSAPVEPEEEAGINNTEGRNESRSLCAKKDHDMRVSVNKGPFLGQKLDSRTEQKSQRTWQMGGFQGPRILGP